MPPTPRIDVYLELAIIALKKLPRFVNQRPLQAYLADDYFQSAVERQLEIAGDALAQIRKNGPDLFKLIPDGDLIVGFRNVLAHGYATLDPLRVYAAATEKAPELLKVLEGMLAQFPEE
jgi:uncharacterized protein with HEPN domain